MPIARLRFAALPVAATVLVSLSLPDSPRAMFAPQQSGRDTVLVANTKPVWPDTASLVAELSVGKKDGSQDYKFARIVAFAVGPKGELFVADAGTRSIRQFDKGQFVRRIGGAPGAPGGYETVVGLSAAPDGRLFLRELESSGINVYSADGKPLGHWPVPPGKLVGRGHGLLRADAASGVMAATWSGKQTDPRMSGNAVVRLTAAGKARDTLRLSDRYVTECPVVYVDAPQPMFLGVAPQTNWTLGARGELVAGCSKQYRFDIVEPGGHVIRVSRALPLVPISKQERDDRVADWERQVRGAIPGWKWTKPPHPAQHPAYIGLFAADDGRIWVVAPLPSESVANPAAANGAPPRVWRDRNVLDVFDGKGAFQGSARIPAEMRFVPEPLIRGDTVWAVSVAADGTLGVTRYRLKR